MDKVFFYYMSLALPVSLSVAIHDNKYMHTKCLIDRKKKFMLMYTRPIPLPSDSQWKIHNHVLQIIYK